jgi:hypothetical protein
MRMDDVTSGVSDRVGHTVHGQWMGEAVDPDRPGAYAGVLEPPNHAAVVEIRRGQAADLEFEACG